MIVIKRCRRSIFLVSERVKVGDGSLLGRSLVSGNLFVQDAASVADSRAGALEKGVNLGRELAILGKAVVVRLGLLGSTSSLNSLPLGSHVLNLLLPVQLGVI